MLLESGKREGATRPLQGGSGPLPELRAFEEDQGRWSLGGMRWGSAEDRAGL